MSNFQQNFQKVTEINLNSVVYRSSKIKWRNLKSLNWTDPSANLKVFYYSLGDPHLIKIHRFINVVLCYVHIHNNEICVPIYWISNTLYLFTRLTRTHFLPNVFIKTILRAPVVRVVQPSILSRHCKLPFWSWKFSSMAFQLVCTPIDDRCCQIFSCIP